VPEYGLAPEHPFPAAVEEAQAAYRGLVEQGFLKIAVAGDSARGGLAIVLLSLRIAKARDGCVGRPVGAAVMSPGLTWHSPAPVWKRVLRRTRS